MMCDVSSYFPLNKFLNLCKKSMRNIVRLYLRNLIQRNKLLTIPLDLA